MVVLGLLVLLAAGGPCRLRDLSRLPQPRPVIRAPLSNWQPVS
jgi:hypothetical protein